MRKYRYSKWRWRVLAHFLDAFGEQIVRVRRIFRTRPPAHPPAPAKILVVQLDHLGDAVLTSPILPRLRTAYPQARIDVLASPSSRPVFEVDPNVDRVLVAQRNWFERTPGGWSMLSAVWFLGQALRKENYDLGIDIRGDILTVFVMALAGITRRLGWAMGGGRFLLTDVADWKPNRHEVRSRLALLDALGIPRQGPLRVEVPVSDSDRVRVVRLLREAWPDRPSRVAQPARVPARKRRSATMTMPEPATPAPDLAPADSDLLLAGRFQSETPILAVHIGAGTAAKRWPVANWRRLVARFLDDGWRVVVVGGPDGVEPARALPAHSNLLDCSDRLTVSETTALLECADLFIGADSGPAHLAACAGATSVVLFSGTNRPQQWRPWSRRALVLRHPVSCQPCHRKACPLADHPCMSLLEPDQVQAAALRWWRRTHLKQTAYEDS